MLRRLLRGVGTACWRRSESGGGPDGNVHGIGVADVSVERRMTGTETDRRRMERGQTGSLQSCIRIGGEPVFWIRDDDLGRCGARFFVGHV